MEVHWHWTFVQVDVHKGVAGKKDIKFPSSVLQWRGEEAIAGDVILRQFLPGCHRVKCVWRKWRHPASIQSSASCAKCVECRLRRDASGCVNLFADWQEQWILSQDGGSWPYKGKFRHFVPDENTQAYGAFDCFLVKNRRERWRRFLRAFTL